MAKTTKPKTEAAAPEETTPQETTPQRLPGVEDIDTSPLGDAPQENTVTVDFPAGLNLRDGPGLRFNVLDEIPNGATLTVLPLPEGAEVPGYALVRYTGGEDGQDWPLVGWINTNFVRED